jgi:hypothetical protein
MYGDNSVAPNGTITWVSPAGDRLLGFGHPMFGDGPTNLPIADARVHTIIPSVERSMKIASPLHLRGTMVQDRQPAIALRTDIDAPMFPVHSTLQPTDPDLPARIYDNLIASAPDVAPNMLASLLVDMLDEGGRDKADVVLQIEHTIALTTRSGPRTIVVREAIPFERGLDPRLAARSRGVLTVAAALDNRFEVAQVRRVDQRVEVVYGLPEQRIVEARLAASQVRAGGLARVRLTLEAPRGGERSTLEIPVRIPDDAGGETVQIDVQGGAFVEPYAPRPASLDDLLDNLGRTFPERSIVVTVYRQAEGLSTEHGLLDALPESVLETLQVQGSTREAVRFKQAARRVLPTTTFITGDHSFRVEVEEPGSFDRDRAR